MLADSNCNCVETGSHNFRNDRFFRQDDRERPRPEMTNKLLNHLSVFAANVHDAAEPGAIWQMNDQRIKMRPLFCFKDLRDSDWIKRVSREPVNRLGWQCDLFTFFQSLNS